MTQLPILLCAACVEVTSGRDHGRVVVTRSNLEQRVVDEGGRERGRKEEREVKVGGREEGIDATVSVPSGEVAGRYTYTHPPHRLHPFFSPAYNPSQQVPPPVLVFSGCRQSGGLAGPGNSFPSCTRPPCS